MEDDLGRPIEQSNDEHVNNVENDGDEVGENEDNKWWENESQYLLSSQQLVEGLSLCDEFLQSQSPGRDNEGGNGEQQKGKALLSEYARLGPEDLKRDLEECQNMAADPANIELDTPPDFRLSQLVTSSPSSPPFICLLQLDILEFAQEFESQDSYIAWGGSCRGGRMID